MDIVVAAFEEIGRELLTARIVATGLGAPREVDSLAALEAHLQAANEPLVVTGLRWPDSVPLLGLASARGAPALLLLEDCGFALSHPAFAHGAAAVLPATLGTTVLRCALEAVAAGLQVVSRPAAMQSAPTAETPSLSARERDVLELALAGLPTKQIARRLAISPNTVKHHLGAAFRKLGVANRAEAVGEAVRRGELAL